MLKTNFFSLKKVNPKKVIYNITFAEPFSNPKKKTSKENKYLKNLRKYFSEGCF